MNRRYIILLGGKFDGNANHIRLDFSLRTAGMICKFESPSAKVFVSADTPLTLAPGHGLLIGQIFTKEGQPISQRLDIDGSARELTRHLLQNTWGDYLAVLVDKDDSSTITLLRDPSGAMPCVYSLVDGEGFITSDIGLAVELGLYRRAVNWQAIAHSLNFPFLRTAHTALSYVNELLPGCTLTRRGRGASTDSAWSPWRFVEKGVRHEDPHEAAEDVRAAVSSVVRTLSTVDDRFVIELSGGLDSSVVATCLHDALPRAVFCTLVMPVSGTDERPYARMVTDALGQELIPVDVGFDNVRFDFPVLRSSVVPAIGILQNAVNEAWEAAGLPIWRGWLLFGRRWRYGLLLLEDSGARRRCFHGARRHSGNRSRRRPRSPSPMHGLQGGPIGPQENAATATHGMERRSHAAQPSLGDSNVGTSSLDGRALGRPARRSRENS